MRNPRIPRLLHALPMQMGQGDTEVCLGLYISRDCSSGGNTSEARLKVEDRSKVARKDILSAPLDTDTDISSQQVRCTNLTSTQAIL